MKENGTLKNGPGSTWIGWAGRPCLAMGLAVIGMIGMVGWNMGGAPRVWAQSRAMVSAGLPHSGMVTDIRERMIEIDGRLYTFDPQVQVFDDEGNQVDLSAIVRNAEVRFRLKQDDVNRIDRIVVYLPQ